VVFTLPLLFKGMDGVGLIKTKNSDEFPSDAQRTTEIKKSPRFTLKI
jgi:hypothetical protein